VQRFCFYVLSLQYYAKTCLGTQINYFFNFKYSLIVINVNCNFCKFLNVFSTNGVITFFLCNSHTSYIKVCSIIIALFHSPLLQFGIFFRILFAVWLLFPLFILLSRRFFSYSNFLLWSSLISWPHIPSKSSVQFFCPSPM